MASAVRFTKAEREFITQQVQTCRNAKEEKLRESILEKLEKSELVKGKGRAPGMSYGEITAAFREVLGDRLAPAMGEFVGAVVQGVRRMGLSRSDLTTIAVVAGAQWKGRIKEQSLVNQAQVLLSAPLPSTPPSGIEPPGTKPVGMDDI